MFSIFFSKKLNFRILSLVLIFLVVFVINVGFSSASVQILPEEPKTLDDLTCEIQGSYDSISWFKNEVNQTDLFNEPVVLYSNTSKDENWSCRVTHNEDVFEDYVIILNSPPSEPTILKDGNVISSGFELTEHVEYTFQINSSDPDGDDLTYHIEELGGSGFGDRGLCETPSSGGEVTCLVDHFVLTGSEDPAVEEIIEYTVEFQVRDDAPEGVIPYTRITFTLIPVNDQAEFDEGTLSLDHEIVEAFDTWNKTISGFDWELDYPLNFSVSAESLTSEEDFLDIYFNDDPETITDTSRVLMVNSTNAHVGNWSITLNVTDDGSSDDPTPSSHNFILEINRSNVPPEFLSNLSNISGVQGEEFNLTVNAFTIDSESGDLNFSISRYENETLNPFCSDEFFLWDIETINGSFDNASANIFVDNLSVEHVICRYVKLRVQDETGSAVEEVVFFNITNKNDPPKIHELSFFENNTNVNENLSDLSIRLFANPVFYKVNATDPDQLTYDINNTGILSFNTNSSIFTIDESTGIMDLRVDDPDLLGVHFINVSVADNAGASHSRVMKLEVLNNTAPIINVSEDVLISSQNDIDLVNFNVTDLLGISVGGFIFESFNSRFDSEIYEVALDFVNWEDINQENVSFWTLNFSKWIENKTQSTDFDDSIPGYTEALENFFANQLVGTHNLSIKVFDEFGAFDEFSSANLSFIVKNENDAPFFEFEQNNLPDGHKIELGPVVVNEVFEETIFAVDFDLFLPSYIYEEELSFYLLNYSSNLSDVHFEKQSDFEAVLSFVARDLGTHNITIMVEDKEGLNDTLVLEFDAFIRSDDPVFEEVRPYLSQGETIEDFTSNLGGDSSLSVDWVENETLTFGVSVWYQDFLGGSADNSLTLEWFVNGELISVSNNVGSEERAFFDHYFDFFSQGLNEVSVVATDDLGSSSSWTWNVDVENVNRPPIFCEGSIEDIIEVSKSLTQQYYLGYFHDSQRFYNPDDDPDNKGPGGRNPCSSGFDGVLDLPSLEFSYRFYDGSCNADFEFDGTTLQIIAHSVGTCWVIFEATDTDDESVVVDSDPVRIVISEAISQGETETERVVTVTETITIPIEEEVDVPKPTKIIYPGEVVQYHNQTIEVPIYLRNNWTEDLSGISLSAQALNISSDEEHDNVSISFSESEISFLPVDEERRVVLTLENYRSRDPLKVNIFADVSEPSFTDSDTLIIAGLEMAGDDPRSVRSLVTYARDLLLSSPECAELNDLLGGAQTALDQGRVEDALRLIDGAINGCKHLLSEEEQLRRERPGAVRLGLDFTSEYWSEIIFGSIALIFLAIVFYVFAFIRMSLKNK